MDCQSGISVIIGNPLYKVGEVIIKASSCGNVALFSSGVSNIGFSDLSTQIYTMECEVIVNCWLNMAVISEIFYFHVIPC